jgi:hypothetical protein
MTQAVFPFTGDALSQVEMVYLAYFNRAGDAKGTDFWVTDLVNLGDKVIPDLTGIAAGFSLQPEAFVTYPFLLDPQHSSQGDIQTFISSVYQHLFDRAPEAPGLAYWTNYVNGILTTGDPLAIANGVGQMAIDIALGAQRVDQTTLANKVTTDDHITQSTQAALSEWTAVSSFKGSPITMTAERAHGGAVSLLVWDGYEFINSQDNGRLWQTALQYDGQGEDNNPTEGGSQFDQPGMSSSIVLSESGIGPTLSGSVLAANWHPINGSLVSDTVLNKDIQMNWLGIPNLIHDHITVIPGSNHTSAAIEYLTTYLPPAFSTLLSFDPATVKFTAIQGNTKNQPQMTNNGGHDAIFAETPDNQHDIAIWSLNGIQLGALFPGNTVKLDGGWEDISNLQAGHSYENDVVVAIGTSSDVVAALHQYWLAVHMTGIA